MARVTVAVKATFSEDSTKEARENNASSKDSSNEMNDDYYFEKDMVQDNAYFIVQYP